jgi:hypothetical protein
VDIAFPGTVSASGGIAGAGRWGVLSDNQVSSFKGAFVIDGVKGEVRNLSQFRVNGSGSVFTHAWAATHAFSSETGAITFDSDQFIAPTEPGVVPAIGIFRSNGSWLLAVEALNAEGGSVGLADVPFP